MDNRQAKDDLEELSKGGFRLGSPRRKAPAFEVRQSHDLPGAFGHGRGRKMPRCASTAFATASKALTSFQNVEPSSCVAPKAAAVFLDRLSRPMTRRCAEIDSDNARALPRSGRFRRRAQAPPGRSRPR